MAKAKEKAKEIKVDFYKNVNECWTGNAYVVNEKTGKEVCLSFSCAPGTRAISARPAIRNRLKEMCEEYISMHPNFKRIDPEQRK